MADIFYGVDREGTKEPRVTVDTSTTSDAIELRVAESADITKKDILNALEHIKRAIQIDETRSDL